MKYVLVAAVALVFGFLIASKSGESDWLMTKFLYNQNQEAIALFDKKSNKLLIYGLSTTKRLDLLQVREITSDSQLKNYGSQNPSTDEIKQLLKDQK